MTTQKGNSSMTAVAPPARILIVDDIPANIKTLIAVLGDGYEISVATSGAAALEAVAHNTPDLILLDVVMPEMDGYQVCTYLKADPLTQEIPVIFITAKDGDGDERRGLELGAIDYITKPFNPPIVQIRVRNHLELKRHRDILKTLSTVDGLTGIPNRRRFDEFLEQEWLGAIRHQTTFSLILIDIDHFKLYNDNYGHAAGDEALKQVAHTLQEAKGRGTDLVARFGGEEFVCVLPATNAHGAVVIGEQMRQRIAGLAIPHAHSSAADHITISLGIITVEPTLEMALSGVVEGADTNLYRAKGGGRNCLVHSSIGQQHPKILIVDDQPSELALLQAMIHSWNFPGHLLQASDGMGGSSLRVIPCPISSLLT